MGFINFIIFELFVVDGVNGIAAHVLASTCVSTTKGVLILVVQ